MKSCNKPTVNKLHSSLCRDIKMCWNGMPGAGSFKWSKNLTICSTRHSAHLFVHLSVCIGFFMLRHRVCYCFRRRRRRCRINNFEFQMKHIANVLLFAIILLMPTCCNSAFESDENNRFPSHTMCLVHLCKRRCSVWFLFCIWGLHFIESNIAETYTFYQIVGIEWKILYQAFKTPFHSAHTHSHAHTLMRPIYLNYAMIALNLFFVFYLYRCFACKLHY